MSKEYEDYSKNTEIDPTKMELSEFMGAYFREGFKCLVMVDNKSDTCNYSFVYLLGYVFSLFVLQLSLTYVSISGPINLCSNDQFFFYS